MPREHSLRQLLDAHDPHDDRERGYLASMKTLLEAGDRAWSRDHVTPGHFTASAFVLSPQRDALLLILHQKLELWLQPGGHVEPTDVSLEAAARREAAEEVGLEALDLLHPGIFDVDVHAIPPFGDQPAHQHFDVRFLFGAARRDLRPASDAMDARWVPLDDVADAQSDESVMRALRRLRALT